jgi:hypothetical protein
MTATLPLSFPMTSPFVLSDSVSVLTSASWASAQAGSSSQIYLGSSGLGGIREFPTSAVRMCTTGEHPPVEAGGWSWAARLDRLFVHTTGRAEAELPRDLTPTCRFSRECPPASQVSNRRSG